MLNKSRIDCSERKKSQIEIDGSFLFFTASNQRGEASATVVGEDNCIWGDSREFYGLGNESREWCGRVGNVVEVRSLLSRRILK